MKNDLCYIRAQHLTKEDEVMSRFELIKARWTTVRQEYAVEDVRIDNSLDAFGDYDPLRMPMYRKIRGRLKNTSTTPHSHTISVCEFVRLTTRVSELMAAQDIASLTAFLEQEVIISPGVETRLSNITTLDTLQLTIVETEVYAWRCLMRSNLEQLLQIKALAPLLQQATPQVRAAVYQSFKVLQLADKESLDFSFWDLTGADFSRAKLGCSFFNGANLTRVNFSNADLSHCLITAEQLDVCVYQNAKLPPDIQPFWDNEAREKLATEFIKLEAYVTKSIPVDDDKRRCVEQLSRDFGAILKDPKAVINNQQKCNIVDALKAARIICDQHRNLKFLLGELLSFILGAGVIYLIAAKVNQAKTGHFGLFTEPKTQCSVRKMCMAAQADAPGFSWRPTQ